VISATKKVANHGYYFQIGITPGRQIRAGVLKIGIGTKVVPGPGYHFKNQNSERPRPTKNTPLLALD